MVASMDAFLRVQKSANFAKKSGDIPTTMDEAGPSTLPTQEEAEAKGFGVFAHLLDARVLRALADLGFGIPTPIQQKAVPLALAGKDILARAPTGSGKTLAYALPIIQTVLAAKTALSKSSEDYQQTRALILVPTRELAEQVFHHLAAATTYLRDTVKAANIARDAGSDKVTKLLLSEKPDIVVATPSKALAYAQNGALHLKALHTLAIDEADLILSYGHDADTRTLLVGGNYLPTHFQTFLMSATMTQDVGKLKGLLLRNPVTLTLTAADDPAASNLTQFYARADEEHKFLLVYVILKLKLVRGKAILFVNAVERGYRLKLFLEKFGLRACVLNAELPINSRYSIVHEFNKGRFDFIVATDEPTAEAGGAGAGAGEFGVARGVDFVNVACVINFDLPVSVDAYTHRVGRTARGGATGTAISFVVPAESYGKSKHLVCPSTQHDEAVFAQLQHDSNNALSEWTYDHTAVDGFKYRVSDTLKSITKALIRESRIKELKSEILTSTKLQSHFEDHPDDLAFLQHDKPLLSGRAAQQHLKHVPSYLVPKIIGVSAPRDKPTYVPKSKPASRKAKGGGKKKRSNPLKKFTSK